MKVLDVPAGTSYVVPVQVLDRDLREAKSLSLATVQRMRCAASLLSCGRGRIGASYVNDVLAPGYSELPISSASVGRGMAKILRGAGSN